jgi:hypothetical protein
MRAIKLFRRNPFIIAFPMLGLFVIICLSYTAETVSSDETRPKQSQSFLSFKGFTMVDEDLDRVIRLEADELTMRPKKYFVFAFKPFNEIVLKNSKITVSQQVKRSDGSHSADVQKPVLFPKIEPPKNIFDRNSTNVISGVHFYGFIWSIRDGEDVFFECSAKHAYLDPAKSEIDLEEFELYNHVSGKKIVARKGRLDLKTNTVTVPTSLIKEAQGVSIEGKLICLDMNLNAFRQSIGENGPAAQVRMQ